MKSLKSKMLLFWAILFFVLIVLAGMSIKTAFKNKELASQYNIKNAIAGHLNVAAGWQAIERGLGATIIGSGAGDSSPLFSKFLEMGKKGDSEVLQAEKKAKNLLIITRERIFEERLNKWRNDYETLQSSRFKIASREISKKDWLDVATSNIKNEFNLRNFTFAPQSMKEQVLYLNTVLRPNIATLTEFAGLERALVGNILTSRLPISSEEMDKIKSYRSIVEKSLGQVLLLKELSSTSDDMKQAIEKFEKEFLQSFQLLREKVFAASKRQEETINATLFQAAKGKIFFQNYLSGNNTELLNVANSKSVKELAKALIAGENTRLSEPKHAVENLFNQFSKAKRIYSQLRYIDSSGFERVRVNFDGNAFKIIRGKQLQNKKHRYYFQQSINLQPGEVYLSQLDLNIEQGKIEIPFNPTLRYATPVHVDGKKAGIIAFNLMINTRTFFRKLLSGSVDSRKPAIIVNKDGFYLHHIDETKEWGMMAGLNREHYNLNQDYPEAAEQILSGKEGAMRVSSGNTVIYAPIFFRPDNNKSTFWVFIKPIKSLEYPVDAATWIDEATRAINTGLAISNIAGKQANNIVSDLGVTARRKLTISIFLLFFVLLVFSFFSLVSKNRIFVPLKKLLDLTKKISEGDFSRKVETTSEDEIAELEASFNKMIYDLQKTTVSRDYVDNILRSMTDTLIVLTPDATIKTINQATLSILGYEEKELIGKPFSVILAEEEPLFKGSSLEELIKKGFIHNIEKTYCTKDGRKLPVLFSGSVMCDDNGNIQGIICVAVDITERKRMEEEKQRMQIKMVTYSKLASLGELSTGVAHEINQPLTYISSLIQTLKIDIKEHSIDETELEEDLKFASGQIEKIISTIEHLRTFGRQYDMQMEKVDLVSIQENTLLLLGERIRLRNIRLIRNIEEKLPMVWGNANQLEQVFINLFQNAIDALQNKKKNAEIRLDISKLAKREAVQIKFSDNGPGMEKSIREKIFEPFFTTKEVGKGTGLGLSITYGIIKEHKGEITCDSQINKGTTFTILLPLENRTKQGGRQLIES